MKARLAAIAFAGFLTLVVIAVGFSALGQAQDAGVASAATVERSDQGGENPAVSSFKFVCPFH